MTGMTPLETHNEIPHYTFIKTIQDNHRYKVSIIEQDGEERILKKCNDPELAGMLYHDVRSSFYLETVRSYNIESVFRVRKIYSYGDDWYIAEKFDGDKLYERRPVRSLEYDIRIARDLYAPFIYETSVYTPQVMLGKNPYVDVQGEPTKNYHDAIAELERHARVAVEGNFLDKRQAETIIAYVRKHLKEVKYGVELYDLEPWEMFVLPEYQLGVIDLEYLNLRGRRHFDVVYDYLRLWLDVKRPAVARAMLQRYMEIAAGEDLKGAFLSLFGIKLVGYLMDAANWMKDTRELGKPVVYSHDETQAILNRYLEFSVEALYT